MSAGGGAALDRASGEWSVCPGCGLTLPGRNHELHDGGRASEACWQLYGEVTGYELAHLPILGRLHQLTGALHFGDLVAWPERGRSSPAHGRAPVFDPTGWRAGPVIGRLASRPSSLGCPRSTVHG